MTLDDGPIFYERRSAELRRRAARAARWVALLWTGTVMMVAEPPITLTIATLMTVVVAVAAWRQ